MKETNTQSNNFSWMDSILQPEAEIDQVKGEDIPENGEASLAWTANKVGKRHPNQIYIGNGLIHRENGTKVKDYGYPQLQALKARLLLNTNECIELLAISDLARANLATLMVYLQETFANEEKELHVDWQMKQVYVTNKEGKRIRKYALCASIRK